MALAVALALGIDRRSDAAEGDVVIQRDAVADFSGLADHDAHAVIDEEIFPDARPGMDFDAGQESRSEEHTSELQSLMRISYAVFCLKKKTNKTKYDKTKKQ